MFDNQLISLIISTVLAGEAIAGIPGLPLKQAFQPTQQGANTQPTAYLHKVADKRYGFVGRYDVWDADNEIMVHQERQWYETTFQFSALATQNPATPGAYTASDILNLIAYILQSSSTIDTFESNGVGIERIMDVRNPAFIDDRARNEYSPSFDFVMTHQQIITSSVPKLYPIEFDIIPI